MKKLKNFRKFHTKSTDRFFHMKYWIVEDPIIAQKLGLYTHPESIGDVYLLRKASVFTRGLKPNVKVSDYDYVSERILSSD